MSEELAIKIFKQFDFEINMCEKCPRKKEKERTCIGCLDNAKESLLNYIEQLQQENKELKEQLKINNQAFNFNVKTIKKHNKENNILTEFEKWLEEDIKNEIEHPIPEIYHDCERCKTIILDKLQELKKEGKK